MELYDDALGQDLFTAWETLLQAAGHDPDVRQFVDEDLVSIDKRIGGGAILTVFETTVRDRDAEGHVLKSTHREVLKIRMPNAEAFVNETAQKAIQVVEKLIVNDAERKNQYAIASRVLRDIKEW